MSSPVPVPDRPQLSEQESDSVFTEPDESSGISPIRHASSNTADLLVHALSRFNSYVFLPRIWTVAKQNQEDGLPFP